MEWNFPKIMTIRNEKTQANKIIDEVNEFLENPTDEECIDIVHAVETLLRIRFYNREYDIDDIMKEVTRKNTKRGYYNTSVY